jgi:subtilisin family serine protease
MTPPRWLRTGFATAAATVAVLAMSATPGAAQPSPGFSAEALTPDERVEAVKAPTSRLAETDRSLLGRTDTARVPILVKLDYDSVATYAGDTAGYEATSPAVTGRPLTGHAAQRDYESYVAEQEAAFVDRLSRAVPEAVVGQALRTVYGGLAISVPANRIGDVLALDGVVAVQADEPRQPLTDSSTEFIGADTLYPGLGGTADAGKGTTIGVLDTGAWPEHPSFADLGNLDPRPGPALACEFGDNPLTPENDPFQCQNKLVGGAAFLDTYHAQVGDEQFPGTARDDNGHGTHTMSTAAGNVVEEAEVFGVDHGPINGVAPGAWVAMYRVCGPQGCFSSDSAAAVAQAVLDGVDVINFSISGGTNPFTDPVELAFLDAYAAGVLVSASAGNDGPGAGTVNHVSPWVTTVAASTQTREFATTLTLTADNGDSLQLDGTSITGGVDAPIPVVMAAAPPYSDPLCLTPAPDGIFAGVIVACERGQNARTAKGFNVLQGDAAGMILFNPSLADAVSDNHWLPTVHLADGTDFVAFMDAHSGVLGSFPPAEKRDGQGDVMAAFSSRGPGGLVLKPDITAPGVQILAGNTPIGGDPELGAGPAGELYQAIAGTSMAAPHIAGAALLLRALHPEWTPGQIKSALMTTAIQEVVKEDLTTPADPLDYGSGRVDLTVAGEAGLTLDETAENMVALGNDPITAVHLNLPTINAPVMPGSLTTTRTVENVTDRSQSYRVEVDAPADSRITVRPDRFTVPAGGTRELTVTITSTAPEQQLFGEIRLVPRRSGLPTQHLPVAFVPKQGDVTLASTCEPAEIRWLRTATCTVTATNHAFAPATVDLASTTDLHLLIADAEGADVRHPLRATAEDVALTAAEPTVPSLAPGSNPAGGWLPMSTFAAPTAIGDEEAVNFTVPPFVFGGQTYDQLGVTSNGYLVVGGATAQDVQFDPPGIPHPARPNNVLAPFWTDLDGTGAPGIRAVSLTDGVNSWVVVEWELNPFGAVGNEQIFQVWIGVNGEEDVSFAYDPANLPDSPWPTVVGAENVNGSGGASLGADVNPTGDLVVTSSDPVPGGSYSYTLTVWGLIPGTGTVTSTMETDIVPGTTVVTSDVLVRWPFGSH